MSTKLKKFFVRKFSMMKRKSLLTPDQEAILKNFNKDFKNNDSKSLNENERIKKDMGFVKTQFRRGANRGK